MPGKRKARVAKAKARVTKNRSPKERKKGGPKPAPTSSSTPPSPPSIPSTPPSPPPPPSPPSPPPKSLSKDRRPIATITTEKGDVAIVLNPARLEVETVAIDDGIGAFYRYGYHSLEMTRKILLDTIDGPHDSLIIATAGSAIIGFLNIIVPGEGERWGKLKDVRVVELGSIEISRKWRHLGLSRKLLQAMFSTGEFEDRIILTQEFAWHWDLENMKMDKVGYKNMILGLLKPFNFRVYPTDEPNITYDPFNMLTIRFGPRVDGTLKAKFLDLLFESEGGWGWG